jgi:hypothetical protein
MVLNIPTFDQIILIDKKNKFRCKSYIVRDLANKQIEEGKYVVCITSTPIDRNSDLPFLISHPATTGNKFTRRAFYVEGDPMHYFVQTRVVQETMIYVAEIL